MTGYSFTTPVWDGGTWVTPVVAEVRAAPEANGPEDQPRDAPAQWDKIDWRAQEAQVRRLRQRIFKAAQEQDWPKVRNLQKLMLRSRANTLVSVRQVTQRNTGRRTAGIDGEVALTSRGQGGCGGAGAPVHRVVASPRGPARVHPEGIKPCEAEAARDSRAPGPLPPATGPKRAGARVGGPVRAQILRVPSGPRLSRRDRGVLQHPAREMPGGCGFWMLIWRRVRQDRATGTCWKCSAVSPRGI